MAVAIRLPCFDSHVLGPRWAFEIRLSHLVFHGWVAQRGVELPLLHFFGGAWVPPLAVRARVLHSVVEMQLSHWARVLWTQLLGSAGKTLLQHSAEGTRLPYFGAKDWVLFSYLRPETAKD